MSSSSSIDEHNAIRRFVVGELTVITRTIKFADASVAAEPILSYAKLSSAAEQYRKLAEEVILYVQERKSKR